MGNQKMKVKKRLLLLSLSACHLLVGCSLLPVEETRPTLVVKTSEKVEYTVESVKREDLVSSKFIYCTYVQLNDESLSFALDDLVIDKVHVEVGNTVKKGDLLAELSLGSMEDEIENLEYTIKSNRIKLENQMSLMNLELLKEEKLFKSGLQTKESYDNNVTNIEKKYKETIRNYEDTLYIDELKMDKYSKYQNDSKIYAGMDGIVSFVKENLVGSKSREGHEIIRIIDNSQFAFRVETEYAPYFIDGEVVDVEMRLNGGDIYKAIVSHDIDNPEVVYFELQEPNFNLNVGDRGTINLILEQKEDVLTVSSRALRKANDFYYVYYVNEDGIRSMKEVTIGMMGNNSVEITSGLEFGDIVITR